MRPSEFPTLPLKRLMRPTSAGAVSIKGHLDDLANNEGFPGYSASGQDVRLPEPQFYGEGLVLSAVGAQCGKCFYASGQWGVVANTQVFLPTERGDARYLFYLANQRDFWDVGGTAQPYVQVPRSMSQAVPAPPLNTQRRIARFLDEKTARIDGLIKKKRELLDRLAEKRQALITHAVTKGLNPDVPMKPSGIDWLGDLPAHWSLRRLKFGTTKIGSGVTPRGGASVYVDSGIMLLRSQNVHFDGLALDDVVFIDEDIDNEMLETRVFFGDVLLNITGASIGRCCLFDKVKTHANVNQHVCIIRPSDILADFIAMLLASSIGQLQIDLSQKGASREGLTFGDLGNFIFPTPPISEQANITQTMQFQVDEIGEQSLRVLQSIDLLEEYRSAVITAAVTGQIEVLF